MTGFKKYLECPFCLNKCIEAKPRVTWCPDCGASFEIDDRGESVFGDTDKIRLPAIGTIFAACGLIQASEQLNCLYCGVGISMAMQ